ncbi:hypothetical protein J7L68_03055 [bacterium]|nr:hypothetical protein [bacterium]
MKKIIEKIRASKTAFTAGVILLIVNPPLGWVGFMFGGYLSAKYHSPKYMLIATIVYAITWGMAGTGLLLAGPRGVALAKSILKKVFVKIKRIFKKNDETNE